MKAVFAFLAMFAVALVGCGKSETTPVPVVPKGGPKVETPKLEIPKKGETPKLPEKLDPKIPKIPFID